MILVAFRKEAAHRQVFLYSHARKHAAAFRHDRHGFTHDARGMPVGNVFTIKSNFAAGSARITTQCAEQRCFSRAVRANQGNNFALFNMQTDLMKRLDFSVVGAHMVK